MGDFFEFSGSNTRRVVLYVVLGLLCIVLYDTSINTSTVPKGSQVMTRTALARVGWKIGFIGT